MGERTKRGQKGGKIIMRGNEAMRGIYITQKHVFLANSLLARLSREAKRRVKIVFSLILAYASICSHSLPLSPLPLIKHNIIQLDVVMRNIKMIWAMRGNEGQRQEGYIMHLIRHRASVGLRGRVCLVPRLPMGVGGTPPP